jgi:hypothetical protein
VATSQTGMRKARFALGGLVDESKNDCAARSHFLFTGRFGLIAGPASTVKQTHKRSAAVLDIDAVIVPRSTALDYKSSEAADRMLAHIAGEVTRADRLPMKTKGGSSLQAGTNLPRSSCLRLASNQYRAQLIADRLNAAGALRGRALDGCGH